MRISERWQRLLHGAVCPSVRLSVQAFISLTQPLTATGAYGNDVNILMQSSVMTGLVDGVSRPPSRRISAEFAEKTSLAENPPEKNAASRKSAE